ncbi:MAG: PQQ-binding-like beta-propeller repeat protein, partial [Planctomycetota bacterium JB042]
PMYDVRRLVPVLLLAAVITASAPAQERAFDGWAAIGDEGYEFDPDSSEVATFSIQVSGEVRFRFHRATGAMKAGDWRSAVEPLQEVIDLFPNHLFQVAPTRWVGAGEYARHLLRTFPPEGRDVYDEWAQLRAAPALRGAMQDGDERRLEKVAWQWALTPQGREAMRVLGDLAQERGQHELAARWFRRRLAFEEPGSDGAAALALRAAAALAFAGAREDGRSLLSPHDGTRSPIAGEPRDVGAAWSELLAFAPESQPDWPTFGGAGHHAALVERGPDDLRLQEGWRTKAFSRPGSSPFRTSRGDQDFPFHPVLAGGSLYLADGLSVRAFSLFSEEPRWRYEGPLFDPTLPDDYYFFEDYTNDPQRGPLGSLARSLALSVTVEGGVVVAPLMDLRPRGRMISFDRNDITIAIPKRSLHAIDAETGTVRWRQSRPELPADAFVNRLSVSAPPVVVDDRVLAVGHILEGAINLYAACFSLADGELLWKTPIVVGQQELTMFNKPFKEFTIQMPAERDGSVFVCSNLGLFACLDTLSGQARWVMQYESIPIMGALHYSQHRERSTTSANDAPVVADGVAIFAPFDSNHIYAVDVATGKRLWQQSASAGRSQRTRYSHVLGVDDGVAILSGRYGIGFFDARTGAPIGQYPFGTIKNPYPRGRGCLGAGTVYQPLYDRLLVLRWGKGPFGVEVTDDEYLEWSEDHAGNFVRGGDVDVVASRQEVTVFFDVDALAAEARRRVTEDDARISDLVLLGQLESKRGDHGAAIRSFDRALSHPDLDEERRRRIHDGLHRAHRELARFARSNDDPVALREHLEAEARYAPDAHAFLLVAEQLLDLDAGDVERQLAVLDWMDERAGDVDYPFRDHPHRGLIRTSLFTLERRAAIAFEREAPERAVAAWQEMIRRHPDLTFDGRPARAYAIDRIARTIASHGAEVYAPFEREAADRHAAAVASKDHAALAAVIERYPNSERVARYRIDLARLQLEAGRTAELFRTVGPLLEEDVAADLRAQALALLAKGAEAAGETRLAGAVWRRLEALGVDLPASGGE